jgi:putative membrane protein
MHMMWGSWGIGMMLMMVVFWAAILVAVIFLIRWLVTASSPGRHVIAEHRTESALDILNKRYARGEISKQEFEDIRRDIQAGT